MIEVSRFSCGECKHFGNQCKCIDHTKVHFNRSCFSCDEYTSHHVPCSAFECVDYYPALAKEWNSYGGFDNWHKLFIEQWHNGKEPRTISIIKTKPSIDGRDVFDDVWEVSYKDFLNCNIMRHDGIHYETYRHLERTRSSPVGYHWVYENEGILNLEE